MPPRHVQVPPELAPAFEVAESLVAAFFEDLTHAPETASLRVRGERYLLIRAKSLSVEFFRLVRDLFGPDRVDEADRFARQVLFDMAHAIGKSDARHFIDVMGVTDPVASMSSGPPHFAWTGWASVNIHARSRPTPDQDFELHYDHPYSFESASWMDADPPAREPVCVMGAGYSSGWCSEAFGMDLVAVETACRACGDAQCRFVMAPPARIEAILARQAPDSPRHPPPAFLSGPRVEDELRASRDALEVRVRERTAELEATNAALRAEIARRERAERLLAQAQRLEAMGRLAGGLAHDFNNLLSIVAGRAEILKMQARDPVAVERGADLILDACQRAADLTRRLATFSRGQPAEREPVDLSDAVQAAADLVAPILQEDIDLAIDADDDVIVTADPTQVDQVIVNLVTNARDAMPNGGTLTLETTVERVQAPTVDGLAPGDYGVLRVTDTGHGMDPETVDRAFDPFFTTRQARGGTGLGLSMVYGIATRHGGVAAIASAPGQGTTVSVYFPLIGEQPTPQPEREATDAPLSGRTLVVVDDDVLRKFIAGVLASKGLDVIAASSGEDALARLAEEAPIDVVVTDVALSGMSGPELAEALPAATAGAAVVFMSGAPDDDRLHPSMDHRAVTFLRKPFTVPELTRALQAALAHLRE